MRIRVAASRDPSCRQGRSQEPSPNPLRGICFWQRNGYRRAPRAAAGPVRSEHRNVDILIPLARKRESPTGPNVPCERRTDPAEPPPPTSPRRQPRHSATAKQVRATRGYAAFLQNAPVVRHTRGFTPGWYAVPRWGTPNASPFPEPPRLHVPTSPAPSPQHTGSTTIVFPQRRPSNHPIEGHTPNPRSGSGIGPERA